MAMVKVRVLEERVPYVGVRGDIKELPERDARTLIVLKKVERVDALPEQPEKEGGYSRRDMRPDPAPKGGRKPRKAKEPSDGLQTPES